MATFSRLSSIAGLAVAGSALGLYLGSSAVSEINPAYYSTPISGSTFHADLVPGASEPVGVQPLPELAAVIADVGRAQNAPDFFAGPEDPTFVSDGASPSSYRAAAAEAVLAEADRFVSSGLGVDELRDIERYAHFRVSQDQEVPRFASLESEAESEEGCSTGEACEAEPAPGI